MHIHGGEYMFKEFTEFCEQNGIARQLTIMDTPHQNGIIERKNRTIIDKAKNMSINNNVSPYLWTKAITQPHTS
jgi:transposase InsO family protein